MKKRLLILALVPGTVVISLLLSGCYTQLATVHDEEYTNQDQPQEQDQYTDTTGADAGGGYAYNDDYYARNQMYFDYYYPSSFYFGSAFYNPWYWSNNYVYYDPFNYGYYPVYNPGWWYPYSGYGFYGGHAYGSGRYATGVTRNFGNTRGVGLTRGGVNAFSGTYGTPPSGTRSGGRTSATTARPGLTKSSAPLPGARVSSGRHEVNRGNGNRGGQTINRGGSTRAGSRGSGQRYTPPPSTRGQGGGNRGGGERSSGGQTYSPPPSAPPSAPSGGGSSGGGAPSNGGARGGNRR